MQEQDSTEPEQTQEAGIWIPLDFPDFRICEQYQQEDGTMRVVIIAKTPQVCCPHCQQLCRTIHDRRARKKQDLPCRTYPIELILLKRRFRCGTCHRVFTEPDTICGWRRRTTCRLRQSIGEQALNQPLSEVGSNLHVGSRFVQTCLQSVLEAELKAQGRVMDETATLPSPRFVGIDEFARRKGHVYDTILCDLEHARVLEVSEGRTLEAVCTLLGRLKDPGAVEAVSMDMSASFRPAVERCLPQAHIVVDHFHVIQHVMKAFRKTVSRWAHKKEGMILLHRKQRLFLKAKEDLTAQEEQERAQIGQRLPLLEQAWRLKEGLRDWYAKATNETAADQLDRWIAQVKVSTCEPLKKALSAFVKWRKEILAFFTYRISNGFVEGKNNRTKMMMRRGYGFCKIHHRKRHRSGLK
jgi:transposase